MRLRNKSLGYIGIQIEQLITPDRLGVYKPIAYALSKDYNRDFDEIYFNMELIELYERYTFYKAINYTEIPPKSKNK